MTAEEFIEERFSEVPWQYIDIVNLMKDFAAHHIILALEAAHKNAEITCGSKKICMMCYGGGCENPIVSKNSIENSYSLENIT